MSGGGAWGHGQATWSFGAPSKEAEFYVNSPQMHPNPFVTLAHGKRLPSIVRR